MNSGWSDQLELAALTLETVHSHLRVYMQAHEATTVPEPLRVPRPSRPDEPAPTTTRDDIRQALMGR